MFYYFLAGPKTPPIIFLLRFSTMASKKAEQPTTGRKKRDHVGQSDIFCAPEDFFCSQNNLFKNENMIGSKEKLNGIFRSLTGLETLGQNSK